MAEQTDIVILDGQLVPDPLFSATRILDAQLAPEPRLSATRIIESRAFDAASAKQLMVQLGDEMERKTRSFGSCTLSRAIERQRLGYGNCEETNRFDRTPTGFKLSTNKERVSIYSKGKFKRYGGKSKANLFTRGGAGSAHHSVVSTSMPRAPAARVE